jgi:hypothetical protein
MKFFTLLLLTLFIASCASVAPQSYAPPMQQNYSNTITFDRSKDEVWAALVDSASGSFFAIKNFERDSGLMTLDFGSSRPEDFVDCGTWTGGGYVDANYILRNKGSGLSMSLSGVMNLLVLELDENKTSLRVNARYILNMNGSRVSYNYMTGASYSVPTLDTFTFDSNGSDSIMISNPALGTIPSRTCTPTGLAERQIVDGVSETLRQ